MKLYENKEAVTFLNEQYWHDSVLYEFRIIRTNSADQVMLIIVLITNDDGSESLKCVFTFNNCYYIETQFYGGVKAISDGEMVYQADATTESPAINRLVESWKHVALPSDLFYFSLTLSSTNSVIKMVCKSVTVENYANCKIT